MKNTILPGLIKGALPLTLVAALLFTNGCKKEAEAAANARFIGNYTGNNCLGSSATASIATGSSNSMILLTNVTIGPTTACEKNISVAGTVSGDAVSFASQSFTDNCGDTYTFSGTAGLSGNTLSIALSGTITLAGSSTPVTFADCFVGTK